MGQVGEVAPVVVVGLESWLRTVEYAVEVEVFQRRGVP